VPRTRTGRPGGHPRALGVAGATLVGRQPAASMRTTATRARVRRAGGAGQAATGNDGDERHGLALATDPPETDKPSVRGRPVT